MGFVRDSCYVLLRICPGDVSALAEQHESWCPPDPCSPADLINISACPDQAVPPSLRDWADGAVKRTSAEARAEPDLKLARQQ